MAIMTGKIQMRQGQEVNFDPDKMSPGEWAVSLDTKYIRMCFSPGVCIRMATYEAFEADMAQIKAILAEAKTVQSAVIRINNEVSDKLDAVVEYTGQAKTYRDQALQYRNDAERFRNETQQVAGGNFLTPESAVSFTEATSRSNIITTDTVKIILGKIKKFFTDLKPHAFSNTTNNLLATVAGTALDAVQGKVVYERDIELNVGRLTMRSANQFATLEEFVLATSDSTRLPNIFLVRDTTGSWGPSGMADWYKCFIIYQNTPTTVYSISGRGFMWNDSDSIWAIEVSGNTAEGFAIKKDNLVKEAALKSLINSIYNHKIFVDWTVIAAGQYAEGEKRFTKSDAGLIKEFKITLQILDVYGTHAYEYPEIGTGYSNLMTGFFQANTSKGVLRIFYNAEESYIDIREVPTGTQIRSILYLGMYALN